MLHAVYTTIKLKILQNVIAVMNIKIKTFKIFTLIKQTKYTGSKSHVTTSLSIGKHTFSIYMYSIQS